jgi:DNA-binding phage protein
MARSSLFCLVVAQKDNNREISIERKNFSKNTDVGDEMALTRDYKQTIRERAEKDPNFATALMNEAVSCFLNGEPETARLMLRELVNSTIGFELLAEKLDKSSKSVHRMLSLKGNPTMDNLTSIFSVLQDKLDFNIEVKLSPPNKRVKQTAWLQHLKEKRQTLRESDGFPFFSFTECKLLQTGNKPLQFTSLQPTQPKWPRLIYWADGWNPDLFFEVRPLQQWQTLPANGKETIVHKIKNMTANTISELLPAIFW